jgi:ribosomal protein L11 methyltransferase
MSWWVIEAGLAGADPDEVARALVEITGQAIEEKAAAILGYATDQAGAEQARAALAARFGTGLTVATQSLPPADWSEAWRNGLAVRTIGPLRIGPSWLLRPAATAVVIDPEMAFGTGEHGSTRGALTLLARHLVPGGTLLDLGSGSGILAIAAVKLGAARALGIELDDEAMPIAEANAAHNGVADRARFVVGDAAALTALAGPVEAVASNILRIVNQSLLEPIRVALVPGGLAVFAGMEATEITQFRPLVERAGFTVIDEVIDEGWWAVAARTSG